MKSRNMNKNAFAAAMALTLAASALAISVSAINYGSDPQYQSPDTSAYSGGGSSNGSTSPSNNNNSNNTDTANNTDNTADASAKEEKTEEKSEPSILTADTVDAAVANASSYEVKVDMSEDKNGNVTLMEDTIAAIVNSGVEVVVEVKPDSKDGINYAVSIEPNNVKDINGSLNIGMDITKKKKMSSVDGVKVPTNAVVIKPKASGNLGTTLKVTVPKSAFSGMTASNVRPYAISGTGKNRKVVLLTESTYVVNEDGSVTILIDNGDVTIVFSDKDIAKAAKKHGTSK